MTQMHTNYKACVLNNKNTWCICCSFNI